MPPPCGELATRHPQPPSTPMSGPLLLPEAPVPPVPPAPVVLPELTVVPSPPGHGVPSAFAGLEHTPVAESHAPGSWQSSGAGHTTGVPFRHSPA
jgi:hypothetical protein